MKTFRRVLTIFAITLAMSGCAAMTGEIEPTHESKPPRPHLDFIFVDSCECGPLDPDEDYICFPDDGEDLLLYIDRLERTNK